MSFYLDIESEIATKLKAASALTQIVPVDRIVTMPDTDLDYTEFVDSGRLPSVVVCFGAEECHPNRESGSWPDTMRIVKQKVQVTIDIIIVARKKALAYQLMEEVRKGILGYQPANGRSKICFIAGTLEDTLKDKGIYRFIQRYTFDRPIVEADGINGADPADPMIGPPITQPTQTTINGATVVEQNVVNELTST